MKTLMIGLGIVLMICWAAGFFIFQMSALIHTVLIASLILLLKSVLLIPKAGQDEINIA